MYYNKIIVLRNHNSEVCEAVQYKHNTQDMARMTATIATPCFHSL